MRDFARSSQALAILAALVLVLFAPTAARGGAGGAGAGGGMPEVPIYSLEGYLDEAPKDAEIIDRVEITRDGERTRELLVVEYREAGQASLLSYLSKKSELPFDVEGKREQLDRLFGARAGARVDGVFQRHGASPRLLIQSLEAPAASKAGSAS